MVRRPVAGAAVARTTTSASARTHARPRHSGPITTALPVLLDAQGVPRTREWLDFEIKRFVEYEEICLCDLRQWEKRRWDTAKNQTRHFRPAFTTALLLHVRMRVFFVVAR